MLRLKLVLSLAYVCVFSLLPCWSRAVRSSESQETNLTLYEHSDAFVRDLRMIKLNEGINKVHLDNIAARIDKNTFSFRSRSFPDAVFVKELSYRDSLMEPDMVSSKSTGKELRLRQYLNDSNEIAETFGKLIFSPSAIWFQPTSGNRPSLFCELDSTKAGEHKVEIAYLTSSIDWHCDYVAVVNCDETRADLFGRVTVDNQSGASYRNAKFQLVTGRIHRYIPPFAQYAPPFNTDNKFTTDGKFSLFDISVGHSTIIPFNNLVLKSEAARFTKDEEQHLYVLPGTTDIKDKEAIQLSLFDAMGIPVKKCYVFEPNVYDWEFHGVSLGSDNRVQVKLEIVNLEKNQLGIPLPKGKVCVYKKESEGALQIIGIDRIDHVSKDEKIRFYMDDASDLIAEEKQIANKSMVNSDQCIINHAAHEITLHNYKKEDVTIVCIKHPKDDWTILRSSHPYIKNAPHTFEFQVKVPACGQSKVIYEIETKEHIYEIGTKRN